MLTELGLQKFDSLIDKCRNDFQRQIFGCDNSIVQYFVSDLHLMWLIYVMCDCTAPFSLSLSVFLPYYFYVFYCSMGPVPEIKIDWLIDWLIDCWCCEIDWTQFSLWVLDTLLDDVVWFDLINQWLVLMLESRTRPSVCSICNKTYESKWDFLTKCSITWRCMTGNRRARSISGRCDVKLHSPSPEQCCDWEDAEFYCLRILERWRQRFYVFQVEYCLTWLLVAQCRLV